MSRARQRIDDRTAPIAPAKLASGTAGTPTRPKLQPNVIASIAPSAAPAETPRVNGVASGLRSRPWNTTPAVASAAPTSAAGERARQPRDEEDLRVDVLAERHARIERAPQTDARRAHQRRKQHCRQRQRAEAGHSQEQPLPQRSHHASAPVWMRPIGTTTRWPAAW